MPTKWPKHSCSCIANHILHKKQTLIILEISLAQKATWSLRPDILLLKISIIIIAEIYPSCFKGQEKTPNGHTLLGSAASTHSRQLNLSVYKAIFMVTLKA